MKNEDEMSTVFWLALVLLLALLAVVAYLLLRPNATISAVELVEAEEDWARLKPLNREKARKIWEVTR